MMNPGWYPDPVNPAILRYWDGWQWTPAARPRVVRTERVSNPVLGWIIAGSSALIAIGSFLPWATALGGLISKAGTDGGSDGWVTLVIGLCGLGIGIAIGAGQGLIWAPILTLLLGIAAGAVGAADVNDISNRAGLAVGPGLVIILLASVAVVALSIAAMFVRAEKLITARAW